VVRQGAFVVAAVMAIIFAACGAGGISPTLQTPDQRIGHSDSATTHPNATEWTASDDGMLSLRLSSDKREYVSGENIEVTVELRNDSGLPLRVESLEYALGSYGNALSIEGPVELQYYGPWKESYEPPRDILPGEIISGTTTLSVVHWQGLDAAGAYRIQCTYHSGDITGDKGLWSGSIRSAELEVQVKREN